MYTKTDVQQQILFEKIMKTRVSDLFGGPKWPDSQVLRPIFYTPLKVAPVSMQSKIDINPMETFWQYNWKP